MRRFVLPSSAITASLVLAVLVTIVGPSWLQQNSGLRAWLSGDESSGPPHTTEHTFDTLMARAPQATPVDAAGWAELGRAESARGQHAQAVVAYRNAVRLRPDDATLLAEYAFSAAVTSQRTDLDDPQRLVDLALQLDPTSTKALTLAGSLALDRGEFETAARDWERLAQLEPIDSPMRREVEASAAQARRLANAQTQAQSQGTRIQLARAELTSAAPRSRPGAPSR